MISLFITFPILIFFAGFLLSLSAPSGLGILTVTGLLGLCGGGVGGLHPEHGQEVDPQALEGGPVGPGPSDGASLH